MCRCNNVVSTETKQTYGIIGNLNCGLSNIIYVYQCLYYDKQYVGETSTDYALEITAIGMQST